jgi:hypothetical protein
MNLGLYQHISPLLVEGPFSLLLVQSHLTKEIKMRGPAKIAGSKMGYKTCPTCKGTGKVPVNTKTPKTKPKPMSSGSKMSDRGGPGKGSAGPGGRGGK